MADNSKLIASAAEHAKKLNEMTPKISAAQQAVEKAVGANPPSIEGIKGAVSTASQPLGACDKVIAEATKVLPAVQKLKEAQAVKNGTDLKNALAKATAALKNLRGVIDMAGKIAAKAAKEDGALDQTLTTVYKSASESSTKLGEFLVSFPGQIELLRTNETKIKAKQLPPQALANSLPQVSKVLQEAGAQITTATSVHSSMAPIVKKAQAAYIPTVREKAAKAAELQKKLAEQLPKARTMLSKGLQDVKGLQAYLKTLGK